jgi:hypothetical protein
MLRVEKVSVTDEKVTYRYYPEQESSYGIVSVNRKTGERSFDKVEPEYGTRYAAHACVWIERQIKRGDFPETGGEAWY